MAVDVPAEIDKGFPIKDKYKANAPSDQVLHSAVNFNSSTAVDLELTYKPNQIVAIQADENCWISFGGTTATKSGATSIFLVKNVPYTFPNVGAGAKFISVIGDSASGGLGVCYGVSNADNDLDSDPNS